MEEETVFKVKIKGLVGVYSSSGPLFLLGGFCPALRPESQAGYLSFSERAGWAGLPIGIKNLI